METNSKEQFISYCQDILKQTEFVSFNAENLKKFHSDFTDINVPNWSWFLSSENLSTEEAFIELVFNASLNGGYFQKNHKNEIHQWQKNGSGSHALQCWIQNLHAKNIVPFKTQENIKSELLNLLKNKPFPNQRLKICLKFQKENFIQKTKEIYLQILNDKNINFETLNKLVNILPEGFGKDPFKKKALLALHMFTGYMYSKNVFIKNNLPLPADYQIPRILSYHNVIKINTQTQNILKEEKLLSGTDKIVMELRAAAVIGGYMLSQELNIPEYIIDAQLFINYRKKSDFNEKTIQKIKCNEMWF